MSIITIGYTMDINPNSLTIRNSQNESVESNNPKELLDFIAKNYTEALNRKMFWDLDEFMSPILRLLGVDICKALVTEPDCEALWNFESGILPIADKPKDFPEGLYSLYYHRQTSMGLQVYGQRKSYFYNLSQFFEDEDIVVKTPAEVVAKATTLVNAFFAMGLNPLKMSSPISVYESNVLDKIEHFTTIADLPDNLSESDCDELIDWSERIMHREWTTNLAVGIWHKGESFDFDVRSAYGKEFSELLDYRYATFEKSTKPLKQACSGLLKGKVTIGDVTLSPICYKTPSGQTINPVASTWNDILTLADVRWIYKHHIGSFEMDYGYFWWYEHNNYVKPFNVLMQRIFDERQQGGLVKKLAKRIGASAWAKTIQRATSKDVNKYYNPIYGLQVKTNCRLNVASFIYDHNLQNNVLHIGTDGVRTNKDVILPEDNRMGAWRKNEPDEVIIMSPGGLHTSAKHPHGWYFNDIVKAINEKPDEAYYAISKPRPLTLGEAVDNEELQNVGEMREFPTTIDLIAARAEQDVDFDDFPATGRELLENKYFGKTRRV